MFFIQNAIQTTQNKGNRDLVPVQTPNRCLASFPKAPAPITRS